MSAYQNAIALPRSIKRDTYVIFQAREKAKQLSPIDDLDLLQHSLDYSLQNNCIFVQNDGSLVFQVLGCNTNRNVIAVMRPNKEANRRPWAIVFVGYDYDNVLGTCPKLQFNRVDTSSKPRPVPAVDKTQPKTHAHTSAAPLYIVCAVWGALATPGFYPFLAPLMGDPLASWALSTQNLVLAIVGLLVGVVLASFASSGYKRRGNSRAGRVVGMALLTPPVALLLSTAVLGLMG